MALLSSRPKSNLSRTLNTMSKYGLVGFKATGKAICDKSNGVRLPYIRQNNLLLTLKAIVEE